MIGQELLPHQIPRLLQLQKARGEEGAGSFSDFQETNMAIQKVAVVTAGGSGMGAAAAKRLAQDGFKVAILSSSGKGEALAKDLGGFGVRSRRDLCWNLLARLRATSGYL